MSPGDNCATADRQLREHLDRTQPTATVLARISTPVEAMDTLPAAALHLAARAAREGTGA